MHNSIPPYGGDNGKTGDASQPCRFSHGPRQNRWRQKCSSPVSYTTWRLAIVANACLAALLAAANCAKVGEPQPPVLLIPKAATDLAARQYGDRVTLTVPVPTQNTDGSPVTTLQQVQVFRMGEPVGRPAAPLHEKEYMKRAERILSISADKFSSYVRDNSFVFQDDFGSAGPSQVYGSTFAYAVRFLNRKKQTAGLSNQAIITPMAIPGPPAGLSAELTQYYVLLRWTPPGANTDGSTPARITGYDVYRSEDPSRFPSVPSNPEPLQNPEFQDHTFQFDKTYYYAVSIVGNRDNPHAESFASVPVKVVAQDTFPPGPPQNLNAVSENGVVILLWVAPPDPDVAGYRIYRSEAGGKEKQLLQAALNNALSFRDEKTQAGKTYKYFITAVDTHGNEGTAAQTTVEMP